MTDILKALAAPFDPKRISWRVGSTAGDKTRGMALAYIDSRDVQDRLDEVCGADGWQCRYPHAGQKTVCEIGIVVTLGSGQREWIWKADGAGDTDVEQEKGALSDAFKRAAVKWGIGRYLYDIESPWVQIAPKGKSYVIAEGEFKKLQALLPGSTAETAPAPPNHGEACGPLGKNELKEKMRAFLGDLAACTEQKDRSQLDALLNANTALLDQCARDLPGWWLTKDGSDVLGANDRITEALRACSERKVA